MANDIGGVWRTIGGRRVFIKDGQSLADAMKESGKFKSAKKFSKREELKKDIAHQVTEALRNTEKEYGELSKKMQADDYYYKPEDDRKLKELRAKADSERARQGIDTQEKYDKLMSEENKRMTKEDAYRQAAKELGYKRHTSDEKQNREIYERAQEIIKEHPEITEYENAKTDAWKQAAKELGYKTHTSDEKAYREIYERAQEILKDNYESKVYGSDVKKADKQMKKVFGDNFKYAEDIAKDKKLLSQIQEETDSMAYKELLGEYNAGKVTTADLEDTLKTLKKFNNDTDDYEYNLYKQARENPDSINPMTEWSTDWEDLDKKFKDRYEKENSKYKYSVDGQKITEAEFKAEYDKQKKLGNIDKDMTYDDYKQGIVDNRNSNVRSLKNDLMTAEQLKGKDREEQKEINKQYLKEQNKLAQEKNDANFAKEWYKGTKKTENMAKENLERAKKNGASVEELSNRTRQVHELELETQKAQEHSNKMKAKAESSENYEKNLAEREKRDKMGQYAYLLEKQRNRGNSKDEKPNELQSKANKVVEAKIKTPVNQLSGLKDRYYKANSDREKNQIRQYTKSALEAVKEGTTLGLVTKDSTAGWTSMGGWHDENTTVKKYTKIGPNKWDTPYGVKTDEDMILTALYNEEPLRDLQEANDIAGIKSMGDKSSFRYYGNNGPNRVTYKNQSSNDVMNNNIRNAYEEYKKKHPGSKINFSKFKDNYKS